MFFARFQARHASTSTIAEKFMPTFWTDWDLENDLRHTYATFLLQKGASVWWVSRQMGHSSIQATVDTYFHYLPDEDDRDAAFLNEFPSANDHEWLANLGLHSMGTLSYIYKLI